MRDDRARLTEIIGALIKARGEIEAAASQIETIGEKAHNAMLDPNGEQEMKEASNSGYALREKLRLCGATALEIELSRKHTDVWVRYKR